MDQPKKYAALIYDAIEAKKGIEKIVKIIDFPNYETSYNYVNSYKDPSGKTLVRTFDYRYIKDKDGKKIYITDEYKIKNIDIYDEAFHKYD